MSCAYPVGGRRAGRCAFVLVAIASFLSGALVLLAPGQEHQEQTPADPAVERAAEVLDALRQEPSERPSELQDRAALLRAGFDAFIERMDAFDGDSSLALARELYQEDPAIWSGFCLEGALRRSAPAGANSESASFRSAREMLLALRESYKGSPQGEIDVTHRLAILGAGFNARSLEQSALGRALTAGGIDGAQITGLAQLKEHPAVAQRLFGSLLDRSLRRPSVPGPEDDESVTPSSPIALEPFPFQPEAAPWALRGHALASLELLRASSSN